MYKYTIPKSNLSTLSAASIEKRLDLQKNRYKGLGKFSCLRTVRSYGIIGISKQLGRAPNNGSSVMY